MSNIENSSQGQDCRRHNIGKGFSPNDSRTAVRGTVDRFEPAWRLASEYAVTEAQRYRAVVFDFNHEIERIMRTAQQVAARIPCAPIFFQDDYRKGLAHVL